MLTCADETKTQTPCSFFYDRRNTTGPRAMPAFKPHFCDSFDVSNKYPLPLHTFSEYYDRSPAAGSYGYGF